MNIYDAANILGLSGHVTPKDVKAAYRKAAMKYHPDRNPAGAEMMKIVNAAFEALKDYSGEIPVSERSQNNAANGKQAETEDYSEAVNTALNAIIGLEGLEIEICGAWVWVGGNTFDHKAALKTAGFKFASKKKRWYFRPEEWISRSRGTLSMDEIRDTYGSQSPKKRKKGARKAIAK